ncbi:MAG: hypothetical protein M3066_03960 [Actinomycetota bacterium]|nr:hypothetical protein [Actinomycetota bacterium]
MAPRHASRRLVHLLVRLHPPGWRRRYGAEFAGVVEAALADGTRRGRLIVDVARGAVDARLHPSLTEGSSPTASLRGAASTAFCAFIAFVIAGMGFQKMTEDPSFSAAAHAHPALAWSYRLVVGGAVLAGAAIAVAALPVAVAVARQARAGRRDMLRLLVIPPVAAAVSVLTTVGLARLGGHAGRVHAAGNIALFGIVVALGLATAVIWGAGAASAMHDAAVSGRALRAQVVPLAVASLAMAAVTLGVAGWGVALRVSDAALFRTDNGVLATPMALSWIGAVTVMAVATVGGWWATTRGFSATRRGTCAPSA